MIGADPQLTLVEISTSRTIVDRPGSRRDHGAGQGGSSCRGESEHDRRATQRPSERKASRARSARDDPRRGRHGRPEGFRYVAGWFV